MNQFWTTVTMTMCVVLLLFAGLVAMGLEKGDRARMVPQISPKHDAPAK
jgi:hypothetical protein